jgi:hypothetical protein
VKWTLAVDIDGTITENGNGTIHLGALGALRSVAAMGHRVVYVTGRSSVEAYVLSVFGGTGEVAVGENGGCITTGPDSHVMLGDMESCQRAYSTLREQIPDMREKAVFPRMTEVVLERTFDMDEAAAIIRAMHPEVTISDSGYAIHINSRGIDKGRGLRELYSTHGAERTYTMAIGDSGTDIPMFREAGLSVALANAPEQVAEAADIVTVSPGGDGVVEALQRLAPRLAEEA